MSLHRSTIMNLKRKLLAAQPLQKAYLVTPVLDYTKPMLGISLETDPVGTSFATWGNVDRHWTLLSMVNRLESGGPGVIVRAVLPFGAQAFPCELLLVDPES